MTLVSEMQCPDCGSEKVEEVMSHHFLTVSILTMQSLDMLMRMAIGGDWLNTVVTGICHVRSEQ
jgi:hypothetical protein